MVIAGLLRASWMPPHLAMPSVGPPWELPAHLRARYIILGIWVAGLLAAAGVAAGLVAVRRRVPLPARTLITGAMVAVVALVVLPPIGSTDVLDYAIYGHIVAIGHSPYIMTPERYKSLEHLTKGVPGNWATVPSVYGPLATGEQFVAAKISGASLAVTAFWLKLVNAIGFAGFACGADRLLRDSPVARWRAHLLWTVNPLLIWTLIAGGHLDVLATAAGVAGLLIADRKASGSPLWWAAAAGLCVGVAADIKITYLLFGFGILWRLYRQPARLAAAALGGAVVLLPSYAVAGMVALRAAASRTSGRFSGAFYGFFFRPFHLEFRYVVPLAVVLMIPLAVLALMRLPAAPASTGPAMAPGSGAAAWPGGPAMRAALALSLAWLLVWPHQYAWYSVMIIGVLIFLPPSRVDWVALIWLSALTLTEMPGVGSIRIKTNGRALHDIQAALTGRLGPLVMLAMLAAFVCLCLSRRWNVLTPVRPPGAPARPDDAGP